mmetsp:Transcript_37204/g.60242  ORF Transcript_37204/g.60242 Transcript_37204/m.60242 type:complete len:118 (-) Transcript_37204:159-512(-)
MMTPLTVICDLNDIRGWAAPRHDNTGKPQVFLFETTPGGVGIVQESYVKFERILLAARARVEECLCAAGCPSCIQVPYCPSTYNDGLDKYACLLLLRNLTSRSLPLHNSHVIVAGVV